MGYSCFGISLGSYSIVDESKSYKDWSLCPTSNILRLYQCCFQKLVELEEAYPIS